MPERFHAVQANSARMRAAADDPVMAGFTERPDPAPGLAEASAEVFAFRERFEAPA